MVGLVLLVVHEVHVLDPTFLDGNYGEPYAREHMDKDEQKDGHHDDLKVHFDILRQVSTLDRLV